MSWMVDWTSSLIGYLTLSYCRGLIIQNIRPRPYTGRHSLQVKTAPLIVFAHRTLCAKIFVLFLISKLSLVFTVYSDKFTVPLDSTAIYLVIYQKAVYSNSSIIYEQILHQFYNIGRQFVITNAQHLHADAHLSWADNLSNVSILIFWSECHIVLLRQHWPNRPEMILFRQNCLFIYSLIPLDVSNDWSMRQHIWINRTRQQGELHLRLPIKTK